ncbi:hypothetical protein PVAND_017064 [Polypedilum vanderplanki]|uniref:Ionotropic receptor n=1 Tax=Polypedilum vanderplanki TaxID=319348 RepID=A0A9J6BHI2_POLVA|nr:hypothetical protein PVAND_017064 [Polypedilum vanderplanki]
MVFKHEERSKKFRKFLIILLISSMFCTSFAFNTKLLQKVPTRDPVKLAKAMVDVIREFYIANDIKFDFIIYGTATNHIKDVINEITKKLTNEISINIMHIKDIEIWDHVLYQSAIIFTKSKKNLEILEENSINGADKFDLSLRNVFPKQFKFLTYIEKIEICDEAENRAFNTDFPFLWPDIRLFEILIIMNNVSINLTARVLFSPNICGKFHLKYLNSFDLKTQKWENELKNFNHFDNFHGCLMTFFVEAGIYLYYDNHKSLKLSDKFALGNVKFRGLSHEILEKLTKDLNITRHYTFIDRNGGKYMSGTKNFMGTYAIGTFFLIMTQNDLYTNYEKLLMPFDLTTWILLSATISLAFGIILISFNFPKWLQTLFHGVGMKDPAFKTLGVIFGISQLKLPQKTVNRFVLGLFLWFCLMFRTCYQSKLFEFMTSDMRKPLPASIEDLKEMNYTIVLQTSPVDAFGRINKEIINFRER